MYSMMLIGALAASVLAQDTPMNSFSSSMSTTSMMPMSMPPANTTATTTLTTTVTAIFLPGATTPATMNGTYPNATMPSVIYIYWEESCGCHQTSSCAASAVPKSLSTTTVTYSEPACGCTTTVEAPCAETVIPVAKSLSVAPAGPASTTTMPVVSAVSVAATSAVMTSATPVAPAAAAFTGGAERRGVWGGGVAFLAVVAALVLA